MFLLWLQKGYKMKSIIKKNARGTFVDGVDMSSVSPEALATAIKVKLGLPTK